MAQDQSIAFDTVLGGISPWMDNGGRATVVGGAIAELVQDQGAGGCGTVLLPALSNAHDHGRGLRTVAFGAGDDALEVWIAKLGLEPAVDPYLRAAVAFGRMALGGVGILNHCHNPQDPDALLVEAEAVARAASDVGVRVAFAVPIMGHNPIAYGDPEPLLAELPPAVAARLRSRRVPDFATQLDVAEAVFALGSDHFIPQYGPVGPQWVDETTLTEIADRSRRHDRRVHMHLLETQAQAQWGRAAYPGGLVAHLDQIGLLSDRLTVAHGVWLDDADCARLAAAGVMVSVNTSSNLRLRSGIAPVARFMQHGLRFGMGLDGMSFDDDEDALRELRLLWHLQRGFGVTDVLDRARLWQAVLYDGRAAILGQDGGGVIAPGAPADLITLRMDRMTADTIDGRASAEDLILTRATKSDLSGLWIAGRRIVSDGTCLGIDLPALEAELITQARANAPVIDYAEIASIEAAYRSYYACGCHTSLAAGAAWPKS